jgi:hypothetical protein
VVIERYTWLCGNTDNPDWSTAPGGTNLAKTKRLASGAEIQWRWYRQKLAGPDLTP